MAILEAVNFDLECVDNLPYGHIRVFCENYANFASREQIFEFAMTFCNDSFKLPLCLYYHPKIIAAACIYSTMIYRKQHGMDIGV